METQLDALPPTAGPASPRPIGHPLVRSALYLGSFFALQVVLALLIGALSFTLEDRFLREGGLLRSTELLLVVVALQAPLMVGLTWLFVRFLDRRALASVGLRWPRGGRRMALRQLVTLPLIVLALVGTWLLLVLVLPPALGGLHFGGVDAAFSAGGPSWWPLHPALLLVCLLLLFLVQGGLEELVVRGYVYHALRERWRPWRAALASSVLFSLLHLDNPNISAIALMNIILAGLVLAALVERSGSLWSASLAHGLWNFSIGCLLSLPVSGLQIFHLFDVSVTGTEPLTGVSFGPEGSLLFTFPGLVLAAVLWRRLQREDARPSALEDVQGNALL